MAGDKKNFKRIMDYLTDFSPYGNLKIMGTNIRGDLLAGLTVAIIALPLALAFGVVSGLGPIAGVWGAICGGIFGSIFGGSAIAVSGPTGPKTVQLTVISQNNLLPDGSPDVIFVFGIIFLSGIIMLAIALLKVGKFIYYTPYSVVSGFMCGIGLIIILIQIGPFFGLSSKPTVMDSIKNLPRIFTDFNPQALLIASATLAAILIWPKITPVKWIPGALLGLLIGTILSYIINADVKYIGKIPTGLPTLYVPDLQMFSRMLAPAAALAGLAIFDSLMTCLIADNMTGRRHNSDREIFGQGLANVGAGLFGGLTTATATMRTVANIKSGARTPLAAFSHGIILLLIILGIAPFVEHVPMPCLAAILIKVGIDILDYRLMPVLHKMPLTDKICFASVFILTIIVDLLVAMGIGIAIAFFRFVQEISELYRNNLTSLSKISPDYKNQDFDKLPEKLKNNILVIRPEGPLFFGTADTLYRTLEHQVHYNFLIISLGNVSMLDLSGAFALEDLIEKAAKNGTEVYLTDFSEKISNTLKDLGITDKIKPGCYIDSLNETIAAISMKQLNKF